jgi:hypothetical protein
MRGGDVNQNLTDKDTILDSDLGISYNFFEDNQQQIFNHIPDTNHNSVVSQPLSSKTSTSTDSEIDFVKCKTTYKTYLVSKALYYSNTTFYGFVQSKGGVNNKANDEIDEIEWSE